MNQVPRRNVLALAVISCGFYFEVGAQPDGPPKVLTQSEGQALADVIGTIAPYVENGQVAGARIGRPGSLFRAVGIERGDVVVQVNGESLTSAQSVLQLRYVSRGSGRPDANRAGVHLKPRPRCGRMDRRGI